MNARTLETIEVLGSKMAYVDVGSGAVHAPTVVFLHGNPTSSFLWRNIIPYVSPHARCIAPDLIGFGQSDKPDIAYRIADHARYLEGFIDALGLGEIVFVIHNWGSALALDWSRRHQERVRGIALMEWILPIPTWLDINEPQRSMFQLFRGPNGREAIIDGNAFVEKTLPGRLLRPLTDEEMDEYRRPFLDPRSREPVYRFPNELPIAGAPADVYAMVLAYDQWLLNSDKPILLFHVEPGVFVTPARVAHYIARLKNCRDVKLGQGWHFVQEDYPDAIGGEIAAWLPTL
jgi:haloalkane dehalogenase